MGWLAVCIDRLPEVFWVRVLVGGWDVNMLVYSVWL